jgi:glycosyltransferase involved in cell wall biosynthesis
MRVLVIHNLKRGGAWRRLSEQVARLDAEVFELTLATAAPVTNSPRIVGFTARAPLRRRSLRPPFRYGDAAALALAWRRLSRIARAMAPDVIFANSCQFLQAPPVLLSTAIPALYFCDEPRRVDYEPEAAATRNPRTRGMYAPLYAYERKVDRASVKRTPRVATNSHYSATSLRSAYGVDAAVVPMGVPDAFLNGPLGGSRDDMVLSVGALTVVKGHDLAILGAARSRKLRRVTIVAPRPDDGEEQRLRRLARDSGIALDVRIGISDAELRSAYEHARVTAYLARAEPFGLAALEAQACGCPVVGSAEGGLREAILDGVTGFGVPRDPEAIARAFDALGDPEVARPMQEAAAIHARAWSWDVSAARVRDLLEEVGGTR